MAFDVSAIGQPLASQYADDYANAAIAALQATRPEWIARNASPEVILIEAMSLAAAEIANTGNAVIGAVTEAVLSSLYQIPRGTGTPATGTLTLTFDSTVTTTIPAGTSFLISAYNVEVTADADVTVTAASTASVAVSSASSTTALNGVGSAASVDVLDWIPNLLSVAISGTFSGGSDPEDDATYIARARQRLARVTSSLVVADHFTAYCLESGLVSNATTIGAWDGVSTSTIGNDAGKVTSVVYGFGGNVSDANKTTLASAMQAITAAGVTVAVKNAAVTTVNVTVTVKQQPNTVAAAVQADVETAIKEYLNPETWTYGATVRTTSLSTVIDNVASVDYVSSLSAPAADVTLNANGLAKYGTLTVTVT